MCLCSGTPDRTAAGVEERVRDAVEITGGGRLDAFFAEYVTPGEDLAAVAGALAHARALGVPAVGATTHSVAVAADLLDLHEDGAAKLDVLMLRYSMAHANHHVAGTLARARALGVGLVGFCSTRWNGLLEGGGEGGGGNGAGGRAPTAAECVRWSLGDGAGGALEPGRARTGGGDGGAPGGGDERRRARGLAGVRRRMAAGRRRR